MTVWQTHLVSLLDRQNSINKRCVSELGPTCNVNLAGYISNEIEQKAWKPRNALNGFRNRKSPSKSL